MPYQQYKEYFSTSNPGMLDTALLLWWSQAFFPSLTVSVKIKASVATAFTKNTHPKIHLDESRMRQSKRNVTGQRTVSRRLGERGTINSSSAAQNFL